MKRDGHSISNGGRGCGEGRVGRDRGGGSGGVGGGGEGGRVG